MNFILFLITASVAIFVGACWDKPSHQLDGADSDTATSAKGTSLDGMGSDGMGSDSGTPGSDVDSNSEAPQGDRRNSVLASGWSGFGAGCTDVSECVGYPAENKQCLHNVMGLVNCPGGYCTTCCNEPGEGVCGQGIDCVGAANAYLICLERCETDVDCRTEDNYICHEGLYYMETIFTGKYCLPDADHITPDPGVVQNITCPWPWL